MLNNVMLALQTIIWAMEPVMLSQSAAVILRRSQGNKLDPAAIAVIVDARDAKHAGVMGANLPGQQSDRPKPFKQLKSVAWIPVGGVLVKLSSQVNGMSQARGTSYESIRNQMSAAMADDSVKSLLMHIDSPGGSVDAMLSLCKDIVAMGQTKPVWAFCDGLTASAGYALASSASKIIAANDDTLVGSIGTYMVLVDSSKQAEDDGLKVILIKSGDKDSIKGAGVDGVAIPQKAIDRWQGIVNSHAESFQGFVKSRRSLSSENAAKAFDGGVFRAVDAIGIGLVDNIDSLDKVLRVMDAQFGSNKQ